jgi:hypothetical protein
MAFGAGAGPVGWGTTDVGRAGVFSGGMIWTPTATVGVALATGVKDGSGVWPGTGVGMGPWQAARINKSKAGNSRKLRRSSRLRKAGYIVIFMNIVTPRRR